MLDPLSQVLERVRFHGMVMNRSELHAPWGIRMPGSIQEIPPGRRMARPHDLPPSAPEPPFPQGGLYVILRGSCFLEVDGVRGAISLAAGDLVVLTRPRGHSLRDSLKTPVRPMWELLPPPAPGDPPAGFTVPGKGPLTSLVCGCFIFDHRWHEQLMSAMPPVIHISGESGHSASWLEDTIRLLGYETAQCRPGWQSVVNHLVHVLFVQAMRAHVAQLPQGSGNWLSALQDPAIGQALGLIYAFPGQDWSVATLAEAVVMSRSAFAARFNEVVGEPPMQCLVRLRMQVAGDLLADRSIPIKQIAAHVGYRSEAAFSHAFSRVTGQSPLACRQKVVRQA
jgi:AraC family transcriptional regulator, alkane utilization regulator